MIRLVELFSGIGAFSKALTNLGIPHERIAMCEIDPHAIRVYEALHGPTPNLGDISKVDRLPDCNLLTYSFPCQDLSSAGKRAGMSKGSGTRSGMLWEVERLLLDARERERDGQRHLPKYLIMENVSAILYKANIPDFELWIQSLTKMGYTSSYAVLNACDYGVPQNRKRCFMISCLGYDQLVFPQPCPDGRFLKDVLEDDVSEKYYLSEKAMEGLKAHKARHDANTLIHVADLPTSYETSGRVYSADGHSPAINTCGGGGRQPKILMIRNATKKGYLVAHEWDGVVLDNYEARGRVQPRKSPTIMTGTGTGTVTPDLRIRRLTPRECWKLQGFGDDDFDLAKSIGTSDSQLYKQAGNSIAVPCLEAILRAMYINKSWIESPTLETWQ
jgi:DNA (cytosine-5)-methyltransferase 1